VGEDMPLTVVSVFERDRKLLEYLNELGIRPGADLEVTARNYDETVTLRIRGRAIPLGKSAASKIWVTPSAGYAAPETAGASAFERK
jgi:DtxR family Mn-dependent transcriptional regulator